MISPTKENIIRIVKAIMVPLKAILPLSLASNCSTIDKYTAVKEYNNVFRQGLIDKEIIEKNSDEIFEISEAEFVVNIYDETPEIILRNEKSEWSGDAERIYDFDSQWP